MKQLTNVPVATDENEVWQSFLYQLPVDFLSITQRLQFMLMIEASWDEFDARVVISGLLQNRELWRGAMMFTDGQPLWPLAYLDDRWNADTLYILGSGKDREDLISVANAWNADATWVDDANKPKLYNPDVRDILRVWWA